MAGRVHPAAAIRAAVSARCLGDPQLRSQYREAGIREFFIEPGHVDGDPLEILAGFLCYVAVKDGRLTGFTDPFGLIPCTQPDPGTWE